MRASPVVLVFVPFVAAGVFASRASAESVTIPSGTLVDVRIESGLSSDDARPGDTFRTTVLEPVAAEGHEVVPAGSTIDGVVTTVKSRLVGRRSGVLGLRFTRLHTSDGRSYDLDGGLVGFRKRADGESDPSLTKATGRHAVVVIGNEGDGPGKRPSSLVGEGGENEAALAERWSHSGLSPNLATIDSGAEITLELRRPLSVQKPR
jgi:hypothetical protein